MDEFDRNTLAAHATAFPDHWDGVISVDDECAAYYQSPNSGCGIGLTTGEGVIPGYDTQIMHQPAYSLFDLLKLAGLDATGDGYRVVPHLPMTTFDLRLPDVGIAQQPGEIRGYFRTAAAPSRSTWRRRRESTRGGPWPTRMATESVEAGRRADPVRAGHPLRAAQRLVRDGPGRAGTLIHLRRPDTDREGNPA